MSGAASYFDQSAATWDNEPRRIALMKAVGEAILRDCPFGLVSWLAERVSLVRVRVDHSRCNGCGACARACPLQSAQHKVEGKTFGADCYSCARCLNVCPEEAITYTCVVDNRSHATPSRVP